MDHFYLHSAIFCSPANSLHFTSTALKGLTILTGSLVPVEHGHGLHVESTDAPHERLLHGLLVVLSLDVQSSHLLPRSLLCLVQLSQKTVNQGLTEAIVAS